jgi:adenosine deaminase
MLEHDLCVTINSDDPAYFGGYVGDNLAAVLSTLKLGEQAAIQLARNSFQASFLDDAVKARYQREIDDVLRLDAPAPTPASPSGRVRPGGDGAH